MTYANSRSRAFDRRAAADIRKRRAAELERLGMTAAMWDMLETVHLARLTPERCYRASAGQTQLEALRRRGLATWTDLGDDGVGVLWKLTAEGAKLAKEGKPA